MRELVDSVAVPWEAIAWALWALGRSEVWQHGAWLWAWISSAGWRLKDRVWGGVLAWDGMVHEGRDEQSSPAHRRGSQ